MSLDKAYDPNKYEADIYAKWESSGAFKPAGDPKKAPFSIIMPPPNANGNLHAGHAMYLVEDILARYARMNQRPTLWLPGADHAGIETQVVYERELAKDGKSRFDMGRQEFYDAALAFQFDDGIGVGVGTIVLLVNAILLALYSFSCHSCRHIMGGKLNHFSKHPVRYKGWQLVSKLNGRHAMYAWISLFGVWFTDIYVRLVASGTITDLRLF